MTALRSESIGGARPVQVIETADRLLDESASTSGRPIEPVRSGLALLDTVLDGGFRPQELIVVGGKPGVGKTIALLQFARAAAESCRPVAFVSYEHSPRAMLRRVLQCEIARIADGRLDLPTMIAIRHRVRDYVEGRIDLDSLVAVHRDVRRAVDRIRTDGPFLALQKGSSAHTDVNALEQLVQEQLDEGGVLVVDYLQRIAEPMGGHPLEGSAGVDNVVDSRISPWRTASWSLPRPRPATTGYSVAVYGCRGCVAVPRLPMRRTSRY